MRKVFEHTDINEVEIISEYDLVEEWPEEMIEDIDEYDPPYDAEEEEEKSLAL